ncbi:MAG TPA: TetR/AcrR family transcriptional regulator [Bacillota bacterium]|jgi:AcrR family transcriptional regulator
MPHRRSPADDQVPETVPETDTCPEETEVDPGPTGAHLVTPPKTKRGAITYDRILHAAEEVFGEKGYYDASVFEITSRAGIGQGTFYLYFKSKKAVFRQLIIHLHQTVRRDLQMVAGRHQDRREAERAGVRAFHRFILRHDKLYRLIRDAEYVDHDLYRWYYSSFARAYADRLKPAMAEGSVRDLDPEALAYCLMGISVFTGERWPVWEGREPPKKAMETILEFILHGLDSRRGPNEGSGPNEGKGES